MRKDFCRKVVVITGATGGIGRALAQRFARARSQLVLIDLDPLQLSALADQLERQGVKPQCFECDITDEGKVEETFKKIHHFFGGIDVLINNAGITHQSDFSNTRIDVFRKVMEVNFFGALYCTKYAMPFLVERKGLIITMSSTAGYVPQMGRSGYSASKYALHGLFESLRAEIIEQQVGVLVVCPGFTDTDIHKNALDGQGEVLTQAEFERQRRRTGRVATPTWVADQIMHAATRNKNVLILSSMGRFTSILSKLFPNFFGQQRPKAF